MYKKIVEQIKKDERKTVNVGLFTHKGCDYDAVCSTLTIGNYLKKELGDKVNILPIIEKHNFDLNVNSDLTIHNAEDILIELDYGIVLDVNEKDRVYGIDLFNSIDLNNRYLFDHHTGNRVELDVLENQKLVLEKASSTCEIVGLQLLEKGNIDEINSYNLYLGMVSDTAGFTRQVGELTNKVIKLLVIDEETKNTIVNQITNLSPVQKELYDAIEEIKSEYEKLKLYKLEIREDESDKLKELKNQYIEMKITPTELDIISILVIICGNAVFLKIRKNENSELDIVELAEKCNGGGHSNRCAGRFFNTTYQNVVDYIYEIYDEIYIKNHIKQKIKKRV